MHSDNPGLSEWSATVVADREGWWTYRVEGWSDPFATWVHDAGIKIAAGVDEDLMCAEGVRVLQRFAEAVRGLGVDASEIDKGVVALGDNRPPAAHRFGAATSPEIQGLAALVPLREFVSASPAYSLLVERERALYGAWYEIFPRSEGAHRDEATGEWVSGTFRSAAERLPAIADMGFDVVYLTPIHPIGTTARKGRNNCLGAQPGDPGSPYAIGSPDGGHDAIHPDLGTFEDFDHFVAEAGAPVSRSPSTSRCRPPRPPVGADAPLALHDAGRRHRSPTPRTRPKKYQDIFPLNFDNDPAAAYAEVRRVIQVWLDHGVRIFRVDNPHTKPVAFWQWLIADVARDHPETIWLSEAFTKPAMMHQLAKAGFQQSYTYYAWRNEKWELEEYGRELAGEAPARLHAPVVLADDARHPHPYMQYGGPTAWKLRAAVAATMSPTYGIYAGYELMEHVARPGAEEQIDNEKYEYKDRQWYLYEPGGPSRAAPSPGTSSGSTTSAAAPRPAGGCATCASTRPTTRTSWSSASRGSSTGPRVSATPSSSSPTSTRTRPVRRGCTSTWRHWVWLRGRPSRRTTTSRTRRGSGARTTSCAWGPTPSPSTSST